MGVREARVWIVAAFSTCNNIPGFPLHFGAGAEVGLQDVLLTVGTPGGLEVEHWEPLVPWVAKLLKHTPTQFCPLVHYHFVCPPKLCTSICCMVENEPGGEVGEVSRIPTVPVLDCVRIVAMHWVGWTHPELCVLKCLVH